MVHDSNDAVLSYKKSCSTRHRIYTLILFILSMLLILLGIMGLFNLL